MCSVAACASRERRGSCAIKAPSVAVSSAASPEANSIPRDAVRDQLRIAAGVGRHAAAAARHRFHQRIRGGLRARGQHVNVNRAKPFRDIRDHRYEAAVARQGPARRRVALKPASAGPLPTMTSTAPGGRNAANASSSRSSPFSGRSAQREPITSSASATCAWRTRGSGGIRPDRCYSARSE